MHNIDVFQETGFEGRPDREREAYALWSGTANGNMTEVARQTEIPVRTLFSWANRYKWKTEKSRAVLDLTQDVADEGKLLLTRAVRAAANRLVIMLNDNEASHHDQRENIKLLAELVFDGKVEDPTTLVDARSIHISAQDLDNPLQAASAALAANVAVAGVDSRKGKRRGSI